MTRDKNRKSRKGVIHTKDEHEPLDWKPQMMNKLKMSRNKKQKGENYCYCYDISLHHGSE